MQHTLVAVFDNRSDAQSAMDELLASGFSRTDVNVSSADPTGQTSSLSGDVPGIDQTHEEGIGASIKHFFTGLFGSDSDTNASRYSDAVTRGHHVLTLTTQSEPEVERAADVIERFGPVDIDERHDLTGSAASLGAGAYQPQSSSLGSSSMAGASMQSGSQSLSQQSALPPGTEPGSLQGSQDNNLYFGTQNTGDNVPRDTSTFQETQGRSLQSGDLDDGIGRDADQLRSSPGSLQGTASLQGSNDASLGGTAITSGQSMQRDLSQSSDSTSRAIPVVQEELKVGKREVQRGGVRVFSRVVETPVDQTIGLREEHVNVERRPVDQPISSADAAFKEQSIELRETAEEAVVQKSARVVEEVLVGKEVSQRQEQIHDTVRHTEVQVENLAGDTTMGASRASGLGSDDAWRKDWDSNYSSLGGSYDDYAPAYRYGNEMRSSSQYKDRDWSDVESDLRSNWESRNAGGPSTWEKFKAAVRHGWDKITPDMDDDDSYYRNHYSTQYATSGDTYDSLAPAYGYGTEARRNPKYQGRNWDDVESDLRTDWDSRYPGTSGVSTWDKMKAAVRHGWNKMTS
ncbi:DUF2382 domain-containing protein [Massilia phyllosphaerae]|uniref:DUF2382 domain-containing protein n=1 Tax=Massilia phyllosphaerae TaxID=3106034 RepID=UPI002B1CB5E3|nr:DUF2382 domain-containing protein [Massilia sp. SGZ-792]